MTDEKRQSRTQGSPSPSACHGNEGEAHCQAKSRIDFLLWGSLFGVSLFYLIGTYWPESVAASPWLQTMAHTVHQMVHAMWWGVATGAIFIGLLSRVPREFIISILGPGGTASGLLRATAAGVLLDLCSHGILMIAAKLYERGASAGQVIAFLLASPWNSLSLTLVLIGLIGLKWTLSFIALSMAVAFSSGWIFDVLVKRNVLPRNQHSVSVAEDFQFFEQARAQWRHATFDAGFFKAVIRSAVRDSRMVVRWLLFGILLAAMLRAVLDVSQFQQLFGPTLMGLIITILAATILEVCSEGSAPIAADIVNRAQAPGNGFAFLMAGVATDYTEIMVLKDTTRSWRFALCLPLITLPQVLLIAWFMQIHG